MKLGHPNQIGTAPSAVIASEARQSRLVDWTGLPRRFAPRNDDEVMEGMKFVRLHQIGTAPSAVIASGAKQSRLVGVGLDCRVATLLAMTLGARVGQSGLLRRCAPRNDGEA